MSTNAGNNVGTLQPNWTAPTLAWRIEFIKAKGYPPTQYETDAIQALVDTLQSGGGLPTTPVSLVLVTGTTGNNLVLV